MGARLKVWRSALLDFRQYVVSKFGMVESLKAIKDRSSGF